MAHVIAVAGKGGVGKTTLCGMLIQYLCEKGKGPILAVDADANSNLNEVLGVKVETTLGDVREEIARAELAKENPIPTGMSKADYAEMRFEDALVEDDDFDVIAKMMRDEGVRRIWGHYFSDDDVRAWIERRKKGYQDHGLHIRFARRAILDHADFS